MTRPEYHHLAVFQYILYRDNLEQTANLMAEIDQLRVRIAEKHKKHRRCDKEIAKTNKCAFCEKFYASDVALKLHLKLKHREEKTQSLAIHTEDSLPVSEGDQR